MFELCTQGSLDEYITNFPQHRLLTWSKPKAGKAAMMEQFLADMIKDINGDRDVEGGGGARDSEEAEHCFSTASQVGVLKGLGLKSRWALDIARGCAFLHGQVSREGAL